MILPNRLLILSIFLCQSVVGFSASLNAKEMPKESAASDAPCMPRWLISSLTVLSC